ncbi:nipped-B protein [Caerostris extrusa]|uniref:Nipped-B protein n=1 Tax=Caerostris extrusa TaxID=172846 RepID=A0AAV4S1T3_CAEEX|nr:nipped-B protein [Caerostris extrusa]
MVHGHQGRNVDHHVPPEQWLQRQCSNIPVHSQPHAFNATGIPPCQPRPPQGNNLNYFPYEHPSTPHGVRVVQNKLNVMPPKSPVAYSLYAHSGHHPMTLFIIMESLNKEQRILYPQVCMRVHKCIILHLSISILLMYLNIHLQYIHLAMVIVLMTSISQQ